MHRMAFNAQEYYAHGYSVGEMDGENAFHNASRKAMLGQASVQRAFTA